ncbi:MAG: MnhB domain-containing protein [Candidatus Cyclobacteriaceae bacterium M2_1C_046]
MNSIILQIAAKYLRPVILIFSLYVLFRGHNAPGGGFIGGLLGGAGILFYAMAYYHTNILNGLIVRPKLLLITGSILLFLSVTISLFTGGEILSAIWGEIDLWVVQVKLGTPILFDTGVYLVVMGAFLMITISILEELEWK